MIELIVGLGNPGPEYEQTRHNAGADFVTELVDRNHGQLRTESKFHGAASPITIERYQARALIPTTFMNHSGRAVAAVANFYKLKPEQILIVHDELDLPAGTIRLKRGGGHGGHNGLRDIISALGSREFMRLRIGISRPPPKQEVLDYVLGRPSRAHALLIEQSMKQAFAIMPLLCAGELERAMTLLHTD